MRNKLLLRAIMQYTKVESRVLDMFFKRVNVPYSLMDRIDAAKNKMKRGK